MYYTIASARSKTEKGINIMCVLIQFEKLLRATLWNCLLFDGLLYQQVDGVAMGCPLGPGLANAFLAHYEQIWLNDRAHEFKPVYYKRYVNDVFVLFRSPHHLQKLN